LRFGTGRRYGDILDVEVVTVLVAVDPVARKQRWRWNDLKISDLGFFGCLPQRGCGQRLIFWLAMSPSLQPPAELRM